MGTQHTRLEGPWRNLGRVSRLLDRTNKLCYDNYPKRKAEFKKIKSIQVIRNSHNYELIQYSGHLIPPPYYSHHNHYHITRSPPLGTLRKSHPHLCSTVSPRDNSSLLPSPYYRSAGRSRPVRPSPQFPHSSRAPRSIQHRQNNCTQAPGTTRAVAGPRPLFVPYYTDHCTYCVISCMYCEYSTVSTPGSRHHAPSLCCDSAVASLSRPAHWDAIPGIIPAPVSPVCLACLCALSQLSAHHARQTSLGARGDRTGALEWHAMALSAQGENAPRVLFDAAVMVRWLVVRRWLEGLSVRGVTLSHTLSLTCVLNCGSDMFWPLIWGARGWPWGKVYKDKKDRVQGRW